MTDVSFCKVQIRTSASYIKLRLESYCGPDGPHNPLSLPRAVGRIPKRSIFDCVIRPESPAPAETWPGLGSTDWISRPLHPTRQGPSPSTSPWWASRPRRVSFRSIRDNSVSVHHYSRKGAPTPEFPRDTGIPPTPEFPPSTGAGRLTECTRWPVIRLCFRPKPGGSCVWCLRNSARPQTQAEEDSGPAAESPSGYAVQVHVFFERKTHGD